jgi:Envelope integrity protein A
VIIKANDMRTRIFTALAATFALLATPAIAQIRAVDPNEAAAQADVAPLPGERGYQVQTAAPTSSAAPSTDTGAPPPAPVPGEAPTSAIATQSAPTYKKDDLIGAAEGVFGKGAAGLAGIIEKILAEQGEPSAYIAGREVSGAFVVGLRYGSGTMQHTVEGQRPVQ